MRVSAQYERELELGADAIRAGHEVSVSVVGKAKEATEVADGTRRAGSRKRCLDFLAYPVKRRGCGINVDTGRCVREPAALLLVRQGGAPVVSAAGASTPGARKDAPLGGL
jgi:hypothetical protein